MALYTHVMYMYMVCCASLTLLIQHVAIVVHTCMCYKSIETQESEGNYLHYISYCSSTDILLHSKVACTQTHCSEHYDPLKGRNHSKDFWVHKDNTVSCLNYISDGYNPSNAHHHELMCSLMMTCCDISDTCKEWETAKSIAVRTQFDPPHCIIIIANVCSGCWNSLV